jgi:hypothetical protein
MRTALAIVLSLSAASIVMGGDRPTLKVFILAGRSNMEGQAVVDLTGKDYNDGRGTLLTLAGEPRTAAMVAPFRNADGTWRVRDDVWIRYTPEGEPAKVGPLGFGFTPYLDQHHFGPELAFGAVLGDAIEDPVLLVKTAWGGKSLYADFRPPSSGGEVGPYYRRMIDDVRTAIARAKEEIPGPDGRPREYAVELAGFVWYHGWNDGCDPVHAVPEYESNLVHLIQDVRRDLGVANLPVVVGEITGPWVDAPDEWGQLRKAQAAATTRPELKGPESKASVLFVPTAAFVRDPKESPHPEHAHHEFGNAETYVLVGDALGRAMRSMVVPGSPAFVPTVPGPAFAAPRTAEMSGYMLVPAERVPEEFNAGFSLYAAAWPIVEKYPGSRFQTGLFGTWMHAQVDDARDESKHYSDIEGGLGWWRDTRFPTTTPKFIMGGVALDFCMWANGPGAGKGRDWNQPAGKYGVAQLSPWLLWPPDGLNLAQGTCGELFGYGYLPLPLTAAKATTAGKPVPTGDQSWTLFLDTENFRGPVAFFTPFFFASPTLDRPELAGRFLDSRPANPNRALQMETQWIPALTATDTKGAVFARVAATRFPVAADGTSTLVHRITSYRKAALWDAVRRWFDGGEVVPGRIDAAAVDRAYDPGPGLVELAHLRRRRGEGRAPADRLAALRDAVRARRRDVRLPLERRLRARHARRGPGDPARVLAPRRQRQGRALAADRRRRRSPAGRAGVGRAEWRAEPAPGAVRDPG